MQQAARTATSRPSPCAASPATRRCTRYRPDRAQRGAWPHWGMFHECAGRLPGTFPAPGAVARGDGSHRARERASHEPAIRTRSGTASLSTAACSRPCDGCGRRAGAGAPGPIHSVARLPTLLTLPTCFSTWSTKPPSPATVDDLHHQQAARRLGLASRTTRTLPQAISCTSFARWTGVPLALAVRADPVILSAMEVVAGGSIRRAQRLRRAGTPKRRARARALAAIRVVGSEEGVFGSAIAKRLIESSPASQRAGGRVSLAHGARARDPRTYPARASNAPNRARAVDQPEVRAQPRRVPLPEAARGRSYAGE